MYLNTQVIGRIGKDATVKDVNNMSVISFSIAHKEEWKAKDGSKQEKTIWINCSYWKNKGKTKLADYIKKGDTLFVEGIPTSRAYLDKQGNAIAQLELRITNLKFISNGKKENTSTDEGTPF